MPEQRCASAAWVSMATSRESATPRDGGLSTLLAVALALVSVGCDTGPTAPDPPDDGFLIDDPVRPPTNRPTTRLTAAECNVDDINFRHRFGPTDAASSAGSSCGDRRIPHRAVLEWRMSRGASLARPLLPQRRCNGAFC